MLELGKVAPSFTLESDTGDKVSLKDFKGQTVVLYFYPKDMTSGCTQESCDFRDLSIQFKKKKTVIVGISKDSITSHQKFKSKYDLPFVLLSDPDGKVCELYGVWKEKSMYGRKYMGIERTTIVISPAGKVEKIYSKVKVKDHAALVLKELS
ncbi:thioredoxin-dependent thiol peroxidase [bacterium]|jgi:peroxiredoxin Q/BCP|nr:thioredoxin-dependent thiol peroxidase [bacterium]